MSTRTNPQPQVTCCACDAMWREYAVGMAAHLKLQLDLYMTTVDRGQKATLNEMLIKAEARRDAAREIIRQHEIAEHSRNPD